MQGSAHSEWLRRREWLLGHLKAAEKPLAVFAANGTLAVEVQEACVDANISVPGEVAIVGIDDYLLSVGAANRSISGVDTNLEEQGYQGAALLDRLMRGAKAPAKPVRIAPAQVITRKSSDILAVNHEGVARGLHFIAEHFADAIGVDDVARAAGHVAARTAPGLLRARRLHARRQDSQRAPRSRQAAARGNRGQDRIHRAAVRLPEPQHFLHRLPQSARKRRPPSSAKSPAAGAEPYLMKILRQTVFLFLAA